jgi:two-component system, OmpR family, response regulator
MIALMTSTQKSAIRILFVEDDEEVRSFIEEFLTDAGYEVDTAGTVALGSSLLDTRKYDLAVVNGRLSDGTGLAVAQKAHQLGVKSLMVTGYAYEFDRQRPDYLTILQKPIRISNLLQAIENALKDRRRGVTKGCC